MLWGHDLHAVPHRGREVVDVVVVVAAAAAVVIVVIVVGCLGEATHWLLCTVAGRRGSPDANRCVRLLPLDRQVFPLERGAP